MTVGTEPHYHPPFREPGPFLEGNEWARLRQSPNEHPGYELGKRIGIPPAANKLRAPAGYVLYPDPGTALYRLETRETGPAGHIANTVRPVEVLDAFADPSFHARTLFIGTIPDPTSTGYVLSAFNFDLRLPTVGPGALSGDIDVQIEGLHDGGQYFRRLSLAAFDQLSISVAAFRALRVRVLRSTLIGFDLVAILSSDEGFGKPRERAIYAQTVQPGPGQFLVPQGAVEFYPAVADPGFGWLADSVSGGPVFVADPASIGVPLVVKGTRFLTALAAPASMEGTWRIDL